MKEIVSREMKRERERLKDSVRREEKEDQVDRIHG